MKITIDLDKDTKEQLRLVKKLIEMKICSSNDVESETEYLKLEKSDNEKTTIIKKAINHLIDMMGNIVPIQDIVDEAQEKNKIDEKETMSIINRLKRGGYVMEPRQGFIQVV